MFFHALDETPRKLEPKNSPLFITCRVASFFSLVGAESADMRPRSFTSALLWYLLIITFSGHGWTQDFIAFQAGRSQGKVHNPKFYSYSMC